MHSNLDIGASVSRALDVFFQWLPLLVGSILILFIGYIVAKVLEGTVRKALKVARLDSRLFATSIGAHIQPAVSSPTRLISQIVYYLVFLGALSLAISTLGIASLTAFVAVIFAYLPNVLAALLIFLVAVAISGSIATIATKTMGETPTGKLVATVLPTLTMIIATFMILNQLLISKEIVLITYAGLIATMVLGVGLSTGLGGRQTASELIEKAYEASGDGLARAKHDVAKAKQHHDPTS